VKGVWDLCQDAGSLHSALCLIIIPEPWTVGILQMSSEFGIILIDCV
jgi:hypothetical protein